MARKKKQPKQKQPEAFIAKGRGAIEALERVGGVNDWLMIGDDARFYYYFTSERPAIRLCRPERLVRKYKLHFVEVLCIDLEKNKRVFETAWKTRKQAEIIYNVKRGLPCRYKQPKL